MSPEEYKEMGTTFQTVETLNSIIPDNYTIPNNKFANHLTKGIIGDDIHLIVSSPKAKKEVKVAVTIDFNDPKIKIKSFTPYDRAVHNAVCSLYEAGNTLMTANMVYRTMNGLTDGEKISHQAVRKVMKSLDKSRRLNCKIDFTEEAKIRNMTLKGEAITKTQVEGLLLATDKITVAAGGREVVGYKLLRKPILYEYAQRTKQVITVPIKLLKTSKAINSTPEVIVIREYLIKRIENMKHNKNLSNKILYQTLCIETGIDFTEFSEATAKNKRKKIRKVIEKLLGYWIQERYIKHSAEYKEGRSFKGIEIFFY